MVKMRNLVKVGNREVKKRYIGNKLIFEDLGDKTDTLSGEEIFTDKADDSVVHVEIDGKSYQDGVPSPDYPIEIHSINDFDVVSSGVGRNLVRNSQVPFRVDYSGSGELNRIYNVGTDITAPLTIDNEYTISLSIRGNIQLRVYRISSSGNSSIGFVSRKDVSETEYRRFSMTFKPHKNELTALYLTTGYNTGISGWYEIAENSLKLEKGTSDTPWTSAPEDITEDDSHPLIDKINLLLSEPLRSVSDVKDRLFRDSDGLWKVERKVKEIIMDGSENWWAYGSGNYHPEYVYNWYGFEDGKRGYNTSITSHFKNSGREIVWSVNYENMLGQYSDHYSVGSKYFRSTISTLSEWKNWLSDNPVTIIYQIETPTTETLPDELQDKLNNLRSFEDSNYVYTIINDKTDNLSENLKPTLHTTFKSKGWYDYYLKTLLK